MIIKFHVHCPLPPLVLWRYHFTLFRPFFKQKLRSAQHFCMLLVSYCWYLLRIFFNLDALESDLMYLDISLCLFKLFCIRSAFSIRKSMSLVQKFFSHYILKEFMCAISSIPFSRTFIRWILETWSIYVSLIHSLYILKIFSLVPCPEFIFSEIFSFFLF